MWIIIHHIQHYSVLPLYVFMLKKECHIMWVQWVLSSTNSYFHSKSLTEMVPNYEVLSVCFLVLCSLIDPCRWLAKLELCSIVHIHECKWGESEFFPPVWFLLIIDIGKQSFIYPQTFVVFISYNISLK